MAMQFRSSSAKHKLSITLLILTLFAIPFALQWAKVNAVDTQAWLAGGAVIGNQVEENTIQTVTPTNNISNASTAAGSSYLGISAQ